MRRLALFTLVMVTACSPAPNLLPQNDLNRPTDVAFMCFGAFAPSTGAGGALQVSGRPLGACHPQDEYDPGATTTTRTFAFLPNSAAGTLTVVDADRWKLVDLDLDTAGYGTAPLGQLPEQISVSDDGCRLISANRGSCDLTLVDPSVLVAPVFSSQDGVDVQLGSPRTGAQTFRPIKGDGTPLLAAPYEAVFLPQDTSSLLMPPPDGTVPYLQTQTPGMLCDANAALVDPVKWPAQPSPKSWYALVTYPSCDLITVVALPSGRIVSSARVVKVAGRDRNGNLDPALDTVTLQDLGTSPTCSANECVGQAIPPQPSASAGTGDGAQQAPPVDAGLDASAADAAADAGGTSGTGGAAAGAGGTPGSGGAATGTGGAAGGTDAGATGGSPPGGAIPGNQYPPGASVGTPIGPSGIAIVPDGSRAYISLANASYVLSVGLGSAGLSVPGKAISLNEGARGSTRVRLNVDPTRSATTGVAGVFVGAQKGTTTESSPSTDSANPNFPGPKADREYLYVIARDGTVRVINVLFPGAERECETNADPLQLPADAYLNPCLPVDPAIRRPFSVGPGIHFPSLPIDIAAADIQRSPIDVNEQSVNGAHAWVITDSGIVYLLNINPVLRDYTAVFQDPSTGLYQQAQTTEPAPFVNTLRDRNEISYALTLDPSSGPPRVDAPPPVPATGPYIEPFWTRGSALNATALSGSYLQTSVFFPQIPNAQNPNDPIDRRAVTAQTWTVAWEGALSGNRNTGKAHSTSEGLSQFPGGGVPGALPIDALFEDGGGSYCQIGVVPGDMITLTGCTGDSQCGIGEVCAIGDTGSSAAAGLAVTGICVDPNRAGAQQAGCVEFLNSLRRYEIVAAAQSRVIMRPHLDEIVLSSLSPPCTPATGGRDGGVAGTGTDGGVQADSCPDTLNDPTTSGFTCESSYPGGGGTGRCLMKCTTDSECRAGRVCVDFGPNKAGGQTCDDPSGRCSLDPSKSDAGLGGPGAGVATCNDPNHRCFCADAPVFDDTGKQCFDQLVNYQVVAGKSFIVAGSQAGILTTAHVRSDGTCDPNPTPQPGDPNAPDPRFSYRIAMNAPKCSNIPPGVEMIDSRVDPDFVDPSLQKQARDNALTLQTVVTSTPTPGDPCFYVGGPTSNDPASGSMAAGADGGIPPTHVRALFKNSQVSFVLANVDRGPTFPFATTFDVHGGFSPQVVQNPTTVEVGMPARIILGPVDSLPQVTIGPAPRVNQEAPYLFVVDQRRLGRSQGGPATRGQLLRINPFLYQANVGSAPTGYQPEFEDYNASGSLFPIQ
jgi:hypothetical protein